MSYGFCFFSQSKFIPCWFDEFFVRFSKSENQRVVFWRVFFRYKSMVALLASFANPNLSHVDLTSFSCVFPSQKINALYFDEFSFDTYLRVLAALFWRIRNFRRILQIRNWILKRCIVFVLFTIKIFCNMYMVNPKIQSPRLWVSHCPYPCHTCLCHRKNRQVGNVWDARQYWMLAR